MFYTVGTVPKSNRKMVEETTLIPLTHMYITSRSLSWNGRDSSIKSGAVKPVLWVQTSPFRERGLMNVI